LETSLNKLKFIDDMDLIFDTEERLQRLVFQLNEIGKDYNINIQTREKVLAFHEKSPIGKKTAIHNPLLNK
jgi:hypothetical protein